MKRREFFRNVTAIATGIGGLSALMPLHAEDGDSDNQRLADIARLYRLQAAFHLAKSTQDIDLLMSLWDVNGSLTIKGDPNSPYVGLDRLRTFLLSTGSFTHYRLSLVPSFKIQFEVHDDEAFFYEDCHDVGDFNLPSRFIASDTYLAGVVRKIAGKWVFQICSAAPRHSPSTITTSHRALRALRSSLAASRVAVKRSSVLNR